jgi:DNA-binding IclR family transcriptional regulator
MTTSNPVRRIATILDAIASARDGITLGELAATVGLPVSTTHRTVNILQDVGYINADPATRMLRIGERLQRVVLLSVGSRAIKKIVRPTLIELANHFSETAYFAQMTSDGPVLADYYLPTRGPRTLVHPGFDFPIHATAAGKTIYAFLPEEIADKALSKKLQRFTDNTIVNKSAVRKELAAVRARGYGISNAELDEGVFALAAPLLLDQNTVLGTIAVTGVSDRMRKQFGIEAIAEKIVQAGKDLSAMMVNMDLDEQVNEMQE